VTDNTLKELEQIIKHRKPYQIRRTATKRNLDVDNATIGDVADFLLTLVGDLKKQGILK